MTDPRELPIEAYTYDLPEYRIAAAPKAERDSSKLLIWKEGNIREDVFRSVLEYLPHDALMVFNDTRVIEARLLFHKSTGAKIEIFCLEPADIYPDITTALSQHGSVLWKCLVGNASSWNNGVTLEKSVATGNAHILVKAAVEKKEHDHFLVRLSWAPEHISFAELLHHAGAVPLPPYIKRKPDISDAERYQTVYAHFSGSVAAPTAGLHFTNDILQQLPAKHIQKDFVTLHVGAGTFKPVKASTMQGHEMHAEFIEISLALVKHVIDNLKKNIIAVGTTSLRTLESLYWLGRKLFLRQGTLPDMHVGQWEPYEGGETVSVEDSLAALHAHIQLLQNQVLITKTSLLIAPGYRFRIVSVLITNFHQPRSTLLLLVAAFIGEDGKTYIPMR